MKKQSAPDQGRPAKTTDLASIDDLESEREAFEAIRQARHDRLVVLGLSAPAPFEVVLGVARAIASAERAVATFRVAA